MMDPSKINRPVARVDRNSWFLRFYLWLWVADIDKVDFCRLFWGYVFCAPFLFIRFLILKPLFYISNGTVWIKDVGVWKFFDGVERVLNCTIIPIIRFAYNTIVRLIPEGHPENRVAASSGYHERPEPYPLFAHRPRKPSKIRIFFSSLREGGGEQFLAGVGKTADKGVEVAQNVWPYAKWLFIAFGVIAAGFMALGCGYLIWLLIGVLPVVLSSIWIAISAAASGVAWFLVTIFTSQYAWIVPLTSIAIIGLGVLFSAIATSRPAKHTGTKAKEATLGFGGAMKMGVKSVKYRTCPVIKVEE